MSGLDDAVSQYLTFLCAGEEYAVDILRVQEIKGWEAVTRVPYAPPYLLGVMNLRGVIVPVIDLRLRLGIARRAADGSTVMVVVRVHGKRGEKTAGLVVDAVSEVYSIAPESVKPPPGLGGNAAQICIRGLATVAGKMVMLLDVDELVSSCIDPESTAQPAA